MADEKRDPKSLPVRLHGSPIKKSLRGVIDPALGISSSTPGKEVR
jgi:hypothetical protein